MSPSNSVTHGFYEKFIQDENEDQAEEKNEEEEEEDDSYSDTMMDDSVKILKWVLVTWWRVDITRKKWLYF